MEHDNCIPRNLSDCPIATYICRVRRVNLLGNEKEYRSISLLDSVQHLTLQYPPSNQIFLVTASLRRGDTKKFISLDPTAEYNLSIPGLVKFKAC